MDFMRALSILFVIINIYWYCYPAIKEWGINIGVVDKILLNFHRTAGLFTLLYFYSPALVFGEVPVEGIHIVKCQQVYVFFYELNGKEVAAHIEVHAPVAEAGFILDAAGRQ